jgi:hypothetical protein
MIKDIHDRYSRFMPQSESQYVKNHTARALLA